MTIHEFGQTNPRTVVLIHPSVVMWDYFEYVIPLLESAFHVVVPALPGYDPDAEGDFTSVEQVATSLEDWLISQGITEVACIYGCSMGGSIVLRMLVSGRLSIQSAILDGAITPYQLPWIVTRAMAVRDFLMVYMGKLGGVRLLRRAFATDELSQEDLEYAAGVLKRMSAKTIWRTFDSCNNYAMPKEAPFQIGCTPTNSLRCPSPLLSPTSTSLGDLSFCPSIEYWYADREEKARKLDIAYVRKHLPGTVFRRLEGIGHGGVAILRPQELADGILRLCGQSKANEIV